MRELIEEQTVETLMRTLAWAGPLAGLLVGILLGVPRRQIGLLAFKGLAVGCLGSLNWGLWRLYSYLTRYDPQTGYFGLERVDVLLLNLAIFAGVGLLLGIIWAWLSPPPPPQPPEEPPPPAGT
ncbi:MAG TPA: hypothetical protein EYP85_08655 [Armatimonadetes bacterium]|nr:hypothetical protein [Armatimonadota bacterium]